MDVRCERCKTEYEFDDARITEAGVTVKCTTCSHVFKVKKKALVFTVPVKGDELAQANAGPVEAKAPAAAPQREWKVRQASGNVFNFKELTTLQKWIVERKVSRDDEISLTGDSWKRLGNIAELASFFQVVDEAAKGTQLAAMQSQAMLGLNAPQAPQPSPAVQPVYAPPPQPVAPQPAYAAALAPQSASQAPQYAPAPAPRPPPARSRVDYDDDELEAAAFKKKGGGKGWLVALLVLAVLGGGGYGGWAYYWVPLQQREAEEKVKADREHSEKLKAEAEAAAKVKADAEAKAKEEADAAKKAADEKAALAAAVVDAGPLDAGVPDAGPVVKAERRDFNFFMAQGDKLREREKAEAALDAYGAAADLKPDRAEPVAGRGLALLDMGQALQAQASFEQALKLNSRYGVALMGLAESLRTQGKKEQAIKAYERYLEELPNGPEANVAKSAIERLK